MLSAGNLLAEFAGVLSQSSNIERIPVSIAPENVGITGDKVFMGFQVQNQSGNLDPAAVRILAADGTLVKPEYTIANLAGKTDSVVLTGLVKGDYTLEVSGSVVAKSQYEVNIFLVGDVNGDHVVGQNDLDTVGQIYGSVAGDGRYQLTADANLDGRINAIDLSLTRRNQAASQPVLSSLSIVACGLAATALPSENTTPSWGGVHDRIAAVTPTAGYKTDAPMQFFESTKGWVQPLSSSLASEGGVWQAPGGPGDTVTIIVDWYSREAGYGDTLVCYQVDDLAGKIGEVAASSSNAYKSAAAGNELGSLCGTSCYGKEYPNDENRDTPPEDPAVFTVEGGSYYSFYLVQGKYVLSYPEDPVPNQSPYYWPYYWFAITDANIDGYQHFDGSGGSYCVEDLAQGLANPAGFTNDADFNDVAFTVTTWSVDIDTDSNNNGTVDQSAAEDSLENVSGSGINQVGKRIFVNKDDDNTNGKADTGDDDDDYSQDDNDFAKAVIDASDLNLSNFNGYQLWLGRTAGLTLYADRQKTALSGGQASGDYWYYWTINGGDVTLPNESGNNIGEVYAEGTAIGEQEVYWQLRASNGTTVVASDTIEINVEAIVWPAADQLNVAQGYQWQQENTSNWEGLALPNTTYGEGEDQWTDAWYISNSLVDFIVSPNSKGTIETIHPNAGNGTQATEDGSDAQTTGTYGSFSDGFTIEFSYTFETSRGDGTWGWVQAVKDGTPLSKLSFVGNSGIKFGGIEAAILDVTSMVGKGGEEEENPLDAFDPAQAGYVQANGNVDTGGTYTTEPLSKLMSGVRYDGNYAKMADNPDYPDNGPPDDAAEFFQMLENNYNRTNGHIKVDVTKTDATYTVDIYLDSSSTNSYSETNVSLTSLSALTLQSHWGSGVIFSDLSITKK